MAQGVIGRDPELRRIADFLELDVDHARVLLVEGLPGVGKSTLWLAGVERAAELGWRVLTARPADAEATIAYAGLGDLLATSLLSLIHI